MCCSKLALEFNSDFPSVSLFHVCLCACSRSLEMSLKAGCCLCGRTALSAWILLFLLPFSHLSFSGSSLKGIPFSWLALVSSSSVWNAWEGTFLFIRLLERYFNEGGMLSKQKSSPGSSRQLWEALSWEWFMPGVNIATVFIVFWHSRGWRITWVFATYLQCAGSI